VEAGDGTLAGSGGRWCPDLYIGFKVSSAQADVDASIEQPIPHLKAQLSHSSSQITMPGPGVGFEYPAQEVSWTKRDALLFANSIGATSQELHFLFVRCSAVAR
jgi:hypothetical protein